MVAPMSPPDAVGHRSREPEVEQPRARPGQHHVAGLQIAMHDAGAVRGGERLGDLTADLERLLDRQRPPRQALRQRLAFEELHDQEQSAADFDRQLADVIQRTDVRVLEPRDAAGFALESLAANRIAGERRRHDLDRDRAIETRVGGAIHLSHAALADQAEHFVGSKPSAGRQHR